MRDNIDAYKEYYVYSWEDTALAAGTGVAFEDVIVKMDSDADFEIMKRIHVATDNRILVRYQDDSYGRQFQNAAMDLRGVSGTKLETTGVVDVGISLNNFIPYILPRPYLVRAGTTYTSSFADAYLISFRLSRILTAASAFSILGGYTSTGYIPVIVSTGMYACPSSNIRSSSSLISSFS